MGNGMNIGGIIGIPLVGGGPNPGGGGGKLPGTPLKTGIFGGGGGGGGGGTVTVCRGLAGG